MNALRPRSRRLISGDSQARRIISVLMVDQSSACEVTNRRSASTSASTSRILRHFPATRCFGVLLIEGSADGRRALRALGGDKPKHVYFLTIDKAKFRKPVVPGDTVEYHVTKMARKKNMWWFRGEAKVAGQVVAEAEVGAMVA
jgi:3-hydroxyacyl-[acyl-carrier-protein] dehydratase